MDRQNRKELETLATPDQLKVQALETMDREIARLDFERAAYKHLDELKDPAEGVGAAIPPYEVVDRLVRYESHLSREFDRTLNQLERQQRIRLGQQVLPAIKLDVSV